MNYTTKSIFIIAILLFISCGDFGTDAATRLAYDIRNHAKELAKSKDESITFSYKMKATPSGCDDSYTVTARSAKATGKEDLSVTCHKPRGSYFYGTTYQANFIVIPESLSVKHKNDEPTIVKLKKVNDEIHLVLLE